MMKNFSTIIDSQSSYKSDYIYDILPPYGGITISVRDSCVSNVIDGEGWVHPERKFQYTKMIQDFCRFYPDIQSFNFNINLIDEPKPGYFNFCRSLENGDGQFLLPNMRFAKEDVGLGIGGLLSTSSWDEISEKIFDISEANLYEKRISKFYMQTMPHVGPKQDYIIACLDSDILDGFAFIGPPHGETSVNRWPATSYELIKLYKQGVLGFDYKPWKEHLDYKWLVYCDGNSLSDRLRLMLCSGAGIIKIKSKYEEFYSWELCDGINYCEFDTVRDFVEKSSNILHDEELALKFSINNKNFVRNFLRYDNILQYIYDLLIALKK